MTSAEPSKGALLSVFLVVVVDLIGFGVIIPLLPFYAQSFGAGAFEAALVMGAYSSAQFIAAPWWGRLSDRIGRRPVLLTALAGLTLCYVWLAFVESLAALFAARIAGGFMAGNISAAFAYAADVTGPENRARGMGLIGAAFGIGFMAGPAIGGVLAGPDAADADFRTPALAAAGLSAAALLFGLVQLKESLPAAARAESAARRAAGGLWTGLGRALAAPAVRGPMTLIFITTFMFAGLEAVFAIWARQAMNWGPEHAGYLFAFLGLLSAAVQGGLIGRLSALFGETRLVIAGAVLLAAGLGAAPLAPQAGGAAAVAAALGTAAAGFSLVSPALTALISLGAAQDIQGGVLGASRSAATLARAAGPAFAGALYQAAGPDAPFFAGAAVMLLTAALAPALARRPAPLR